MHRTVEAIIDEDGNVHLLEPLKVKHRHRALLTILDEASEDDFMTTALLSKAALDDWNRPEEDEAWSHLQPEA